MRPGMDLPAQVLWLALLLLTAACSPPDRWKSFERYTPPAPDMAEVGEQVDDGSYSPVIEDVRVFEVPEPGSPWRISVEQAVMLSLKNNRDLEVNRLNPVIAGTFEELERGAYDPELFAELEYSSERSSRTSGATGGSYDEKQATITTVLGARQELPTGTGLEATVEHEGSSSDRAPDQDTARVGLSVTQALLRGFGPSANLASVRQASLDAVASRHELEGFVQALLAEVETGFWEYVLAVKEIEIFEQSLEVARRQRDEIVQRIEVGLLPAIEVAAARSEVARREQELIAAKSLKEESSLKLLRLMGHDLMGAKLPELVPASEPGLEARALSDLAERLMLAEKGRADLAEARLRIEQGRLELIATRNGMLPRLDLFLTLGNTGYSDSVAGSFGELGSDTYDFSAGVRLSHLLGNREHGASHRRARLEKAQAARALANLRELARLDVRLAYSRVERARLEIAASAQTLEFQEETVLAEQERFAVGASTALLVSQAQRDLLAAQIARVEAIVNYRVALVRLYLAEGSLMERRGVSLWGTRR